MKNLCLFIGLLVSISGFTQVNKTECGPFGPPGSCEKKVTKCDPFGEPGSCKEKSNIIRDKADCLFDQKPGQICELAFDSTRILRVLTDNETVLQKFLDFSDYSQINSVRVSLIKSKDENISDTEVFTIEGQRCSPMAPGFGKGIGCWNWAKLTFKRNYDHRIMDATLYRYFDIDLTKQSDHK